MYHGAEFACDILLNYAVKKPKLEKTWSSKIFVEGDVTFIDVDLGVFGFERHDDSNELTAARNARYIADRFYLCNVFEAKPNNLFTLDTDKEFYELSDSARLYIHKAGEAYLGAGFSHRAILIMRTLSTPEQIKHLVNFDCPIFMEPDYDDARKTAKSIWIDKGNDAHSHPDMTTP